MAKLRIWAAHLARVLMVIGLAALAGGCALGPRSLEKVRLPYNEAIKTTSEEQLLLNIVRLRYTDSPTSLAVSTIAAQFEQQQTGQLLPFFSSAGADTGTGLGGAFQTNAAILPSFQASRADRPTFTFTPLDDTEFSRKLFTPLTLEGVLYLADTSWPISTVLRLYMEFINGIPNGELGSGPTSKRAPVFADFLRGVEALQVLRDREDILISTDERVERIGGAAPTATITPAIEIEAAKSGYEFQFDEGGKTRTLVKKSRYPVLAVNPLAVDSPEMLEFTRVFHLQPGLTKYEISREAIGLPFPAAFPERGLKSLVLEPRSLGQALFFVANGVEVPPAHIAKGYVRLTLKPDGGIFDWQEVLAGLFKVCWAEGRKRPANAYVAVCYRGYWFYIDERDHDTKATFALLMAMNRLDLNSAKTQGPLLTLPLNTR